MGKNIHSIITYDINAGALFLYPCLPSYLEIICE